MHVRAVTACSGTLIGVLSAAVVCTGSPAYADGIRIRPNQVGRGESVSVAGSGCRGREDSGVTVTSPALRTEQGSVTDGRFEVSATVRPWVRGGRFVVTGTCRPSQTVLSGTFEVDPGHGVGGFGHFDHFDHFDEPDQFDEPDHFDEPDRFPRTGGGGMANVAASHHSPVGGLAGATGLVLLVGAVGIGGVTIVRSRARARGRG